MLLPFPPLLYFFGPFQRLKPAHRGPSRRTQTSPPPPSSSISGSFDGTVTVSELSLLRKVTMVQMLLSKKESFLLSVCTAGLLGRAFALPYTGVREHGWTGGGGFGGEDETDGMMTARLEGVVCGHG